MKTVVFVGAHDLMVPFINSLSHSNRVLVYETGTFTVSLESSVIVRRLPKKLFGINHLQTGERSMPWYLSSLSKTLLADAPDDIVVLDFIRLWYLQVLWYRLRHRSVKVHLYSESQRIPRSFVSCVSFFFFWLVLFSTQKLLTSFIAFTEYGVRFAKMIGVKRAIVLLPAPIDTQLFYLKKGKEFFKGGILKILMNARYVPYKRHSDLLQALVIVKASGRQFSLTFVGRGGDRSLIELEVEKLGLSDMVTFLEPVPRDKLVYIYQEHDILVLPSNGEAIGMVVPEAMACGLVTVTSDTVGANVYVQDGKTGIIYPTGDIKSLASVLLQMSPAQCNMMGTAAEKHIKMFASYQVLEKKYRSFLISN